MNSPFSYALCDKTVTVYRRHGGQILRFVCDGCHFAYEEEKNLTLNGENHEVKCLLIMPGQVQRIFPGDRVFDGVGPEVSEADWTSFIPAKVAGLAQIAYAKPCFWDGELCHVEAGRK